MAFKWPLGSFCTHIQVIVGPHLHVRSNPLPGAKPPMATLPNAPMALDACSPGRLLRFDLDGQLVGALDLSAHYQEVDALKGAGDRVFAGAIRNQPEADGTCAYTLIAWMAGP